MFCFKWSCFSTAKNKSEPIVCMNCNARQNIIILDCKHIYCVKCYNKGRFCCYACEKQKSAFKLF